MKLYIILALLLCTVHGIAQEKIDGWLVFNTGNSSIPNNHVRDLQFDRKSYLWVATWGGGLSRYFPDDGSWKFYNQTNSDIPGSKINQIAIDKSGRVWVVAADGGFGWFDGRETWESVKMPKGVHPQSIAVNRNGVALIGTYQDGLYIYSKDKILSKVWGESSDPNYSVTDIAFDKNGNALVCTSFGMLRFTKVTGGMYTSVNKKIADFPVYKVAYDKKREVIWAIESAEQKVVKYTKKRWKVYKRGTPDIGIAMNGEEPTYRASEITIVDSRKYSLTMGTHYFGGIAAYGGKFWGALYTPYSDTRMTGGIEALTTDRRGSLWVGTWNRGMMVRVGDDIEMTYVEEGLTEEETANLENLTKKQKKLVQDRKVEVKDTLYSATREVEIWIWDAQKIDGDTISLMLNGKFVLENHGLTKHPKKIRATLQADNNSIVLYAHNLGKIPPNTATISIIDLGKQKEITLMSDMKRSQSVIVVHDQPRSDSSPSEGNK
jgi:ligand-binding sensor domain-containing protein